MVRSLVELVRFGRRRHEVAAARRCTEARRRCLELGRDRCAGPDVCVVHGVYLGGRRVVEGAVSPGSLEAGRAEVARAGGDAVAWDLDAWAMVGVFELGHWRWDRAVDRVDGWALFSPSGGW